MTNRIRIMSVEQLLQESAHVEVADPRERSGRALQPSDECPTGRPAPGHETPGLPPWDD